MIHHFEGYTMNHENAVIKNVQVITTAKGWRLFRNSVGLAWAGNIGHESKITDKSGRVVDVVELYNARRVHYGLVKGSSDLIGSRPVLITQDMVGQTIAQFVSVECKTKAYGKTTEEQDNWLGQVAQAGGFAALARERKGGEIDIIPIEGD